MTSRRHHPLPFLPAIALALLAALPAGGAGTAAAATAARRAKPAADAPTTPMKAETFTGLELRGIGPAVTSGRIVDIAVHPTDRYT